MIELSCAPTVLCLVRSAVAMKDEARTAKQHHAYASVTMLKLYLGKLNREGQENLLEAIRAVIKEAPLVTPFMKTGSKFRVQLTSCGSHGWWSDDTGYRYTETHPVTGKPWPAIPKSISDLAIELSKDYGCDNFEPQSCLINYYSDDGRLGLHQDKDEEALAQPVVSISLGDSCIFQFGGPERDDPLVEYELRSGDCVVFGGPDRLAYHGVKRIKPKTSNLLPNGGRYNLTIRQVKR